MTADALAIVAACLCLPATLLLAVVVAACRVSGNIAAREEAHAGVDSAGE